MELVHEIEPLLAAIEGTQAALASLYVDKRQALRQASVARVDELNAAEQALIERLRHDVGRRAEFLDRMRRRGLAAESIESIVKGLSDPHRTRLLDRLRALKRTADVNQRDSWVLWIVAQQSLRVCRDVLDLIAHGGRKDAIYSSRPDREIAPGGAILDATA
jgi:hypothetical protein